MGILLNVIKEIKKEVEVREINFSETLNLEINDYISNRLTDKVKGRAIIMQIINSIIENKQAEIDVLKVSRNTSNVFNRELEEIKALLAPERKPFQNDKEKYFRRYQVFFFLTIITTFFLIYLLLLPFFNENLFNPEIATQIIYRISVLLPFSTIIALLIYQFQNALKHYHKACESIHIMGSYPAIINAISMNKAQKEKANTRLFEILFDWHPRPNRRIVKKRDISYLSSVLKELKAFKKDK